MGEADGRFRLLFEHANDAIALVEFQDDIPVIEEANPTFRDVFVPEEATVEGRDLDTVVASGDRTDQARTITRAARSGELLSQRLTRETVDGPREFLWQLVPIEAGDGDSIEKAFAIYTDVTDQTRERERFQAFIEQSTDIITVLDANGTYQYQSPSSRRITGYEPEALIGESAFEYIHPDDRQRVMETFYEAVEDPSQTARAEYRFRHQDGAWIWLESVGNYQFDNPAIEGFVVNTRHITERKRQERALNALHDATQELIAADTKREIAEIASRTATDVLDLPVNGVHLYDETADALIPVATSDANQDIIGDAPTFHRGDGLAWAVFESGDPQLHADVRETGESYNPDTPIRSELVLPLGDHGVFLISSTEVDDFDDADTRLAKILAANVETTLNRAEREAELERQTARLDEFAGVVSHDLRNPLNVAVGRLNLAKEEGDSEHFETAEQALERMDTLISDLLALAREGDKIDDLEPVSLERVVEQCWATGDTQAATVSVRSDRSVWADRTRFQQLLENLIRNAVEHGPDDVSIVVDTLENGFYLEDDGPGIPEDQRQRVFDAGYSTTADGTGFGLSIVREIADGHGWRVDITESSMGGTRFEFTGVRTA